jgi:hypothetical protein
MQFTEEVVLLSRDVNIERCHSAGSCGGRPPHEMYGTRDLMLMQSQTWDNNATRKTYIVSHPDDIGRAHQLPLGLAFDLFGTRHGVSLVCR